MAAEALCCYAFVFVVIHSFQTAPPSEKVSDFHGIESAFALVSRLPAFQMDHLIKTRTTGTDIVLDPLFTELSSVAAGADELQIISRGTAVLERTAIQ